MYHLHSQLLRSLLIALLAGALPFGAAAQSVPTDGLQLWLQADAVTDVSDGDPVATWTDQSDPARALSQTNATRRPTYVADAINGRPLLHFDQNDGFGPSAGTRALAAGSGYTVVRVTRQGDRGYVGVAEGTLDADDESARQRFFRGQVAEVLVYDRRLTEEEKTTASSALGQKYGLRPGATAARSDAATGGPNEGIRVHGAWTITVRDPDGSLAEQRTVENELDQSGGNQLVERLAREQTVGAWGIFAKSNDSSSEPCERSNGDPVQCVIVESASSVGNFQFENLDVSINNQSGLVLSGSFDAQRDGGVDVISTANSECDPSTAPADCTSFSSSPSLTTKTLSSPVSVSEGQQVNVEVVISFQ